MQKLAFVFLIACSSIVAAPGKEILLSECNVYPQFKKEMVRYLNNGPSLYGAWYFDLVYKRVRQVLLTDSAGYPLCDKPITRSEIQKGPRFELAENFGKADDVARDVIKYLAAHEIEKCD